MAVKWNPNNQLKYMKMRAENESTRELFYSTPMLELQNAVDSGGVGLSAQFNGIAKWCANQGIIDLFSDPALGLISLSKAVHFQAADMEVIGARHFTFPRSTGHISEFDVVLHLARAFSLGNTATAQRFFELLCRDPGVMSFVPPLTRTPAYIFNLYSDWAQLQLPPQLKGLELREPYTDLLACWRSTDNSEVQRAILVACDFHVARSRFHNSRENFEFPDEDYQLQPVELHMLLRMREMIGLKNPEIDHPIFNNPAGKLYPVIQVEPDPMIAPALKIALAQIEEEKKGRGLP